MFEGLLEKILLYLFGKFVSGVDREHISLGVWSGNLVIENVRVKNEAIEMLEWPIKHKFSFIEKLEVKIPWKRLSDDPVQIRIQNVFILVKPKKAKKWRLEQMFSVPTKKQELENFIKRFYEEKIKMKADQYLANKQRESSGYIDKLL